MMKKARVFISCGQITKEEKDCGIQIAKYFRDKGFFPYFAEEYHTPEALTENIYNSLRQSEYFLSINFERDNSLVGSLFIQQELAIASFLKIPILPFHKRNVKLEGVSKYLLLNSIEFNNAKDIIKKLDEATKDWDSSSKNQLMLSFENHHKNFSLLANDGKIIVDKNGQEILTDWYHITVYNLSNSVNVKNCLGYIESIEDLNTEKVIFKDDYKTELIWAGTDNININIPKKGKRDLDAFLYYHKQKKISFHQKSTSTQYRYPELKEGKYRIVYIIISDNIDLARIEINFNFDRDIEIISSKQL